MEECPVPELSELIVPVSPSVPPVRVVDDDRGIASMGPAALSAGLSSVENCGRFLRQLPSVCKLSKTLFGAEEDGR